jgi:hypothetical protein
LRAIAREIDTAKEIDMIQVRLTGEGDPFVFEVVVSEGKGETRHHVTMSRERASGWLRASTRRSAASRQPSGSCSTVSRRNRFSDASM